MVREFLMGIMRNVGPANYVKHTLWDDIHFVELPRAVQDRRPWRADHHPEEYVNTSPLADDVYISAVFIVPVVLLSRSE